ncbi:MAG TPA: 50S ribosomal protein L29 [Aggregatilineales bacterium]|nr:50S ribosomal protein L29 [Anaerolineae bacterium]HUN09723.1 50S ribosomal protein L29 [Aggregatilineales bacterium]
MKITEIRAMTDEELLNAIEDQKESLYNLRFQKAVGQIEDLTAPRRTQRTISRLMTVLRERQLAAQAAKKGG